MPLQAIEIETAPSPEASILVLHGLGADGTDFVPIAEELRLDAAGGVRFVFPHAPMRPVTLNGGAVMRAWYDVTGNFMARREDEATLRASRLEVEALIARERERGVPASRIVIAGFSQGAAMALLTGLRHDERLAGIVALSGYLPLAMTTAAERHAANADVPIFMAHGRSDAVISFDSGELSRDTLRQHGYAVDWHAYPIAHSVCAEEIADLNRWLLRRLSAARES